MDFTLQVFGHVLSSLPLPNQHMCTNPRSLLTTRRGDEWRGVTGDAAPDVGPPPNSHWPTERAPDDGGSSPRPHAEPAALQAAGLSEGEEAGADERVKIIQSRQTLRYLSE